MMYWGVHLQSGACQWGSKAAHSSWSVLQGISLLTPFCSAALGWSSRLTLLPMSLTPPAHHIRLSSSQAAPATRDLCLHMQGMNLLVYGDSLTESFRGSIVGRKAAQFKDNRRAWGQLIRKKYRAAPYSISGRCSAAVGTATAGFCLSVVPAVLPQAGL